jgi:hypothetical protein
MSIGKVNKRLTITTQFPYSEQGDCVRILSGHCERPQGAWQSLLLKNDEIASVVSLPRNDIVTQLQDERGYSTKEIGTRAHR